MNTVSILVNMEIMSLLKRGGIAFFVLVCLWCTSLGNASENDEIYLLHIPSTEAGIAVKRLARQTEHSLLFQNAEVEAVMTNALDGNFSLIEAIDAMFEGTKLTGGLTDQGVITVTLRAVQPTINPEGNMKLSNRKSTLLGSVASIFTALVTPSISSAQTTDIAPVKDEIIVVGTQIKGSDIAGILPVTSLSLADIEATGAVSGDELLESVPQLGAVTFREGNFTGINGARGDVGSVNLRGVGTGSTLVLLNGRRLVNHPGTQSEDLVPVVSVNSNALPVTGIQRMEVLRDGAAAIYGTDAVAGVINTVLDDNFEGLQTEIRYGGSEGTSLRELSGTVKWGKDFNDGRTNFSVFGNLMLRKGMPATDLRNSASADLRPFFVGTTFEGNSRLLNLSSNSQFGTFRTLSGRLPGVGDNDFHVEPDALGNCRVDLPGPVCAVNRSSLPSAIRLDVAGFRDLVGDTDRYNLFGFVNHELENGMEFFGEASYYHADYTRSRESAQILSSNRIVVPGTSFYNPFGVDLTIRNYRPIDTGLRTANVKNDSFRILGGFRGTMGNWDWESAFLHSEATTKDRTNRISNTLFQQALARTDATAYNVFAGADVNDFSSPNFNANSQATIDSFIVDVKRDGKTKLTIADAKFSNPAIFSLPGGDVGMAVGAEWRHEAYTDDRDDRLDGTTTFTDLVTGRTSDSDVLGSSPTPDTNGGRDVFGAYAEFAVPLVSEEMDIPLVHNLSMQLAARAESYSDVGEVFKPKIAGSWFLVPQFQVRGSYSEGFRAPNLEQINATGIRRVNGGREDWILCEAVARAANTTFTDDNACDGNTVESVRRGGPDLKPETNTNLSLGAVFEPTQNITFTFDYWRIKQKDLVGIFSDQNQISLDYLLRLQGSSNPNVIREAPDAGTIATYTAAGLTPAGDIIEVIDPFTNLDSRTVQGYDFGVIYNLDTDNLGDFRIKFNAAYLDKFFQSPSVDGLSLLAAIDAGTISNLVDVGGAESRIKQNAHPEWRGTASVTWRMNNWGAGAFYKYVGDVVDTGVSDTNGDRLPVGSFKTLNLYGDYTFEEVMGGELRVRLGVRNVGDVKPPIADEFGRGYFSGLHSNRGRYWYGSVRKKF
jgi:outer membrane receptor protein involved in Fe transport